MAGCASTPANRRTGRTYQEEDTPITIEIGVFHNGASDLPALTTPEGVVVNDGTLADVHASYQRVLVNQVRQGILAERLGFDYFFMTEHHFQPEGAEFSPNPLLTEMAIAAQTKRIRLGQAANILTRILCSMPGSSWGASGAKKSKSRCISSRRR
ncbi:MAG: LLM class flavin-dependent oxidoreductase [Nitrospinae bacterium]|nr:LLM class flavin-dependent oxidoreductase [Nitrospinota bacterium]